MKVEVTEEGFGSPSEDRATVEQLLNRLFRVKPVLRTVVEMKVFAGQAAEEIAAELGYAPVITHRYWQLASELLQQEIDMDRSEGGGAAMKPRNQD